ncbi:MAG: TonB-dependent receptor [Rhodospirillaceae bacterium]|nr:TonB-dependent receptor [Rhodospirillaceae bacterium]
MNLTTPQTRLWAGSSLLSLALALTAGFGTAAYAEDAEDLGKVVVSANRTATPINQVGSSITVVTEEDIEKSQATTLEDVLIDVPGVSISSNGGPGTTSYVSIRGMTDAHILVMIDGVPVGNPSGLMKAGGYDMTNLLASNIERVEVLRGNQSTLYGSRAIGGVISITTKSGKHDTKAFAGSATLEAGTYNSGKGSLNVHGRVDNTYYNVATTRTMSSGFDISGLRDGTTENDGFDNRSFNATVGSDILRDIGILDKLNIEGTIRHINNWADIDGSVYNWGPTDTNGKGRVRTVEYGQQMKLNADLFNGLLSNTLTASRSKVKTDYFSFNKTRENASSEPYDGDIRTYSYEGVLKPVDDHTFVFGVDHERDHIDVSNINKAMVNDAYYGNYQLTLLDKRLTLTAGIRFDDHETFGMHSTYRGTIGYRIPETATRLHASYGTGFKAPTVYQLYGPDAVYNMGGGPQTYKIGNTNLKPEESRGYDIGVEQSFFGDRVVADVTFFNTRLTNMFDYDQALGYYNRSSSRSFGFEDTLSAQVTNEIKLTASHTYTQARDNDTGQTLSSLPHNEATLRANYAPDEVKGLDLWARGRFSSWRYDTSHYKAAPYLAGWSVWDVGGAYQITDSVNVFGRVENLLDANYYTKGYYCNPGRAGYVGMTVKF